jgi:hypothetical protein
MSLRQYPFDCPELLPFVPQDDRQALRLPARDPGESNPMSRSLIAAESESSFHPSGEARRATGGAQAFSTPGQAARQLSMPRVSTPFGSQAVSIQGLSLNRAIRSAQG